MTRRVLLPCWLAVICDTGVAKSETSRRRFSVSGSVVFMKSTTTVLPCWRMSTLVFGSLRSTTTRPSLSAPRRKSMPRSERPPVKAPGPATAWAATGAAAAGAAELAAKVAPAAPPSATSTRLPSTVMLCVTGRFRLTTTRDRPPDCTTLTERTSPWFSSTRFLPSPFTVCGRSSATRAGFATEKLAGTPAAGFLSSIVTTTPVVVWVASMRSMALSLDACAAAVPATARRPRVAANRDTRLTRP